MYRVKVIKKQGYSFSIKDEDYQDLQEKTIQYPDGEQVPAKVVRTDTGIVMIVPEKLFEHYMVTERK